MEWKGINVIPMRDSDVNQQRILRPMYAGGLYDDKKALPLKRVAVNRRCQCTKVASLL